METKICKTCGIEKEVTRFHKWKKDKNGNQLYRIHCGECTQLNRKDYQRPLIHFICKNCNKPSTAEDKRYTTFCNRDCSFEYKTKNKKNKAILQGIHECTICHRKEHKSSRIDKDFICSVCKEHKRLDKVINGLKTNGVVLQRKLQRKKTVMIKQREKETERQIALHNHVCQECHCFFPAKRMGQEFCEECRKAIKYKREYARDKRRYDKIIKNGELTGKGVDWGINLTDLAERDKNICHICNKKVDWQDKEYRNNTTVTGKKYPSTDHVIAIDSGGTHTWDNVKLAHNQCNGIKSNKAYDDTKDQLQFYM